MADAWGGSWGSSWGFSWGALALPTHENVPAGQDVCARCGTIYPERWLKREWTGMRVCQGPRTNNCFDWRHPQLSVRGVPDRQAVPNPSPEPADVFIDVGTVTADDL